MTGGTPSTWDALKTVMPPAATTTGFMAETDGYTQYALSFVQSTALYWQARACAGQYAGSCAGCRAELLSDMQITHHLALCQEALHANAHNPTLTPPQHAAVAQHLQPCMCDRRGTETRHRAAPQYIGPGKTTLVHYASGLCISSSVTTATRARAALASCSSAGLITPSATGRLLLSSVRAPPAACSCVAWRLSCLGRHGWDMNKVYHVQPSQPPHQQQCDVRHLRRH